MLALLEYLKHWFSSLFGTVKQEFDGTVKKEEVKLSESTPQVQTVEKDAVKVIDEVEVPQVAPCAPLHRSSKLTMEQARAIRADRHIKTIKELAAEYSVSNDTIKRIIDNKTYKEC